MLAYIRPAGPTPPPQPLPHHQMGNKGAFIKFKGEDMVPHFTTFEAAPHPNVSALLRGVLCRGVPCRLAPSPAC